MIYTLGNYNPLRLISYMLPALEILECIRG